MTFDQTRGSTLLFGGQIGKIIYANDTWTWNGTGWSPRQVPGTLPPPRGGHTLSFDSDRHVAVLFGGATFIGGYAWFGDTWEWNGSTWTQKNTPGPSPREGHTTAYDSAPGRKVTVLYGGFTSAWSNSDETWEWNGTNWTLRTTVGPGPQAYHAMAYDQARRVTVLLGSADGGKTWEWDGSLWKLRATSGPPPRSDYTMVYDSARGLIVLYGGDQATGTQTWQWDGTVWTHLTLKGPTHNANALAYDSLRNVTVLFGGWIVPYEQVNNETWELGSFCAADFNNDGFVNGDDFDAFSLVFVDGDAAADFDGNGFVTGDDFDAFVAAFEAGC